MPRRCCVPGCRSNYKGEPYTNIFSFPKDEAMKSKWERLINRKDFKSTDSSVVCIKHFDESFIIRDHKATKPDGSLLVVPRKSPILTPGAYPTIFPEQPSYLTQKVPPKRKTPEERHKEIDELQEKKFQQWCESDKIKNFDDFKSVYKTKLSKSWLVLSEESCVYIGMVNLEDIPKIFISVKISEDFVISVWHDGVPVPESNLIWLLGSTMTCTLWSTFDCLISHLSSYDKEMSYHDKLKGVVAICNSVVADCDNITISETLTFLVEQLHLCSMKSPRYSPDMLLFASKFYFSSPTAYRLIRDSSKLILPHPFYLKTLLQSLGSLQAGVQNSQIKYLKKKCCELSQTEKIVGLMMDEIYIKPGTSYKGGRIEGVAMNMDNTEASTIQAFMITSLFSKNKDVVGLFPVKNQTAEDLFLILNQVLRILNEAGYKVLYVSSDNNRVNRKTYEKLCGGQLKPSIPNPSSSGDVLFLLFDTVHCMKSVRNNWLNNHDTNQTFFVPPMKFLESGHSFDEKAVLYASLTHLKILYKEECDNNLKLAPSLNRKSLYPNHLERQNVGNALKLFDEKLIPALKESENKIGKDVFGTVHFIDVFSKFWKMVNVKTPHKGKHKRDPFSDPVRSSDCPNMQFLENFVLWLQHWESLPPPPFAKAGSRSGKLSKETYFALNHTVQTLVLICKYLFQNIVPSPKYILLGKFQTDCLEARFGQYRCMNGGNYQISIDQVLESERKLKVLSLLNLKSAKMGSFNVKDFLDSCKDEEDVPEMSDFFLDAISLSETIEISESNMKVLVFIAGYVARKASKSCSMCKENLATDKEMCIDIDEDIKSYLQELDRGGLLWPNKTTLSICNAAFKIFQMCISEKFEEEFLKFNNQRYLLCELCKEKLQEDGLSFEGICKCGKTTAHVINDCIKILSNIFLNNYTKTRNDKLTGRTSNKRKLATVSTPKVDSRPKNLEY